MNVLIESSHAPSLACLEEYLRRCCRGELNRVSRVRKNICIVHILLSLHIKISHYHGILALKASVGE
jgi:hypothetical protein